MQTLFDVLPNVIIYVEPNEAELLIDLVEMLISDCYVARHTREEKLKQIATVVQEKAALKQTKRSQ